MGRRVRTVPWIKGGCYIVPSAGAAGAAGAAGVPQPQSQVPSSLCACPHMVQVLSMNIPLYE